MSATPDLLLVNPSAGGGRAGRALDGVRAALDRVDVAHRVVTTTSVEHGRTAAASAAAEGARVIVMSGDGLIGQVGGELAGTGAVMGVIPGGRGNDLARVLGIPTDVEGAIAVLTAGATRDIDVGEVNGARFLGIASCGFDSDANRIANQARRVRGPLVYAYAALRALSAWRPARFRLEADGQRFEVVGYTVAAANSRAYGGGMFIAPDAELDDGLLDVVTVGDVSKRRFLQGLPAVFRGEHVARPEVSVRRCAELRIEADRPFTVYADGDPIAELPATVRLLPRALRVIAPPAPASGS